MKSKVKYIVETRFNEDGCSAYDLLSQIIYDDFKKGQLKHE